jgi:nucleoid DNA-binding protein
LDTVAVPGFGNFEPVKHLEQVVTDRVSGQRMLLPPEIELTFHPGTKLRGQIEKLNRGV